jgi:hypothetical protein
MRGSKQEMQERVLGSVMRDQGQVNRQGWPGMMWLPGWRCRRPGRLMAMHAAPLAPATCRSPGPDFPLGPASTNADNGYKQQEV